SLSGFGLGLLLTFLQLGGVRLSGPVLWVGYAISVLMIVGGLADAGIESRTGRSLLGSRAGGKLQLAGVSVRFSALPERFDLAPLQPVLEFRNKTRKPLAWQLTEHRIAVNPSSLAGGHAGHGFAGKIAGRSRGEVPMPTLDVPVGMTSAEVGYAVEYGALGEHLEFGTRADLHLALQTHTGDTYPSVTKWTVVKKRDWTLG